MANKARVQKNTILGHLQKWSLGKASNEDKAIRLKHDTVFYSSRHKWFLWSSKLWFVYIKRLGILMETDF